MTVAELIAKHKILQDVECGVYIGDGWTGIIDNLCNEIEAYCKLKKIVCVVGQVKEKFGTLRFYVDNSDASIDAFVNAAEEASEHTCEKCAHPGELRSKSWLVTLCDDCYKLRNAKK